MHMLLNAYSFFYRCPKNQSFREMCRHTAGLLCDKDTVPGVAIGEILIREEDQ